MTKVDELEISSDCATICLVIRCPITISTDPSNNPILSILGREKKVTSYIITRSISVVSC